MEMFRLPVATLLKDLMQKGVGDEYERRLKRVLIKKHKHQESAAPPRDISTIQNGGHHQDTDAKLVDDEELHDGDDNEEEESDDDSSVMKSIALLSGSRTLDNSGPALYDSYSSIICMHKVSCMLPIERMPLRAACELVIAMCILYGLLYKLILPFFELPLVIRASSNPTFVVVQSLAFASATCQMMAARWFGVRNSDTCYKILKQTRLCFLDARITRTLGDRTLIMYVVFLMYNSMLLYMLCAPSFAHFVRHFHWFDCTCILIGGCHLCDLLVGVVRMDFFIRSSLALWVIGLRDHLKRMFIARRAGPGACQALDARTLINAKVWTFERIQSSLNHMDDNLEELRGIQEMVIVFLTINSFVMCGSCVILAFEAFANQNDYYHGTISVLLVISISIVVSMSYLGDGYLYYALTSLIYCIECEYYTNMDIPGLVGPAERAKMAPHQQPPPAAAHFKQSSANISNKAPLCAAFCQVVVHNKDILFYQEFLKQFENHLATPWSQMTFNSHLRIVKGFVTLVASQIMFEHQS